MVYQTVTRVADIPQAQAVRASGYRKATLRIIPFLFVCYFFAFLDRVNVGFAKLQMLPDLHFSEAVSRHRSAIE